MNATKIVVALLAIGVTGVSLAAPAVINFNSNEFDTANAYNGGFTLTLANGTTKVYGPPSTDTTAYPAGTVVNTSLNLADVTKHVDHNLGDNGSAGAGTVTAYRVYVQEHSAVVGNVSRKAGLFNNETLFVGANKLKKVITGDSAILYSTGLPESGTYKYSGRAFGAKPVQGSFDYTIKLAGADSKGSGNIVLDDIPFGPFKLALNAKLEEKKLHDVTVQLKDGTNNITTVTGIGIKNGNVTFSGRNLGSKAAVAFYPGSPKYDLSLFGPNGQEVAGYIHEMPGVISDILFAGKQ